MNKEENMADILKLLVESVNDPTEGGDTPVSRDEREENEKIGENMSLDELRKSLQSQYKSGESQVATAEKSAYELDEGFLAEFTEDNGDEAVELVDPLDGDVGSDETEDIENIEEPEEEVIEEPEVIEEVEINEDLEEDDDIGELEQIGKNDESFEDSADTYEDIPDGDGEIAEETETEETVDDTENAEYPDMTDGLEDFDELMALDALDGDTDFEDIDNIDEFDDLAPEESDNDTSAEETDGEETDVEEDFNEFTNFPKYKPVSLKETILDYGRPNPTPDEIEEDTQIPPADDDEADTPDIGDILSDFDDYAPSREDNVNLVMHKLMSQLGCEEELENVSPEALGEVFAEYEGEPEEYDERGSAQIKRIRREDYKKNTFLSSLKLGACALMTLALFLYDTLPLFDVEFFWLADYDAYPGAYVMIGAQLLTICAVCLWRPMLEGIKKLFSFAPDAYSMAFLILVANIAYDVVFLINENYDPFTIPMFHFLSGAIMLGISLTEFIIQWREAKNFSLYSSDMAKFTITHDMSKNSIANKMYSGGFSKERRVYAPTSVSRPKGFTKAIREGGSFNNSVFSGLLHVSLVAAAILLLVLLILQRTVDEAAISAMAVLFCMLPVGAIAVTAIPMLVSTICLSKRGIALTGKQMIRKYAKTNVLVYNDLHMFRKCGPRDVGFVCYEKSRTNEVLAALEILYSRIGGPMSEVFSNIPDNMKAKRIRVRRITRSGVEALVDKTHVLLVGDAEFMRRYGIEFSVDGKQSNPALANLYISYDGKASAKISAKYMIEPSFEALIERLSQIGGHCVIETYDPVINTAFVSRLRKIGNSPVSVVHKNASDVNRDRGEKPRLVSDNGILALSSRFKLVEAVVWCDRLCKIEKISNILTYVSIFIGTSLVLLAAILGALPFILQYILLLYLSLIFVGVLVVTLVYIPKKNYFTPAEVEREIREKMAKNNEKQTRKKR